MTMRWVLATVLCGALLAVAALAAERAAGWFRLPRRWFWAAAMAASLGVPAVALALPGVLPHLRLPARNERAAADPSPSPATDDARAPAGAPSAETGRALAAETLPRGAYLAWAAASLAIIAAFAAGRRRLIAACGALTGQRVAGTRVLVSERAGPMVLGVLDPSIVLPRWALGEPADELRLIVRHEREHVEAGDPWLLAVASLAVALMPWSPALWWMHRRLRLAVETDCDARVLARGESRRRYGQVLLRAAERESFLAAPALGWAGTWSHLERRIIAMTSPRPAGYRIRASLLAASALALAAAACGVASAADRTPAAEEARTPAAAATPAQRDTGIVIEEGADGQLQGSVEFGNGQGAVMLGPRPGAGRTGFVYHYPGPAGRPGVPAGPGRHATVTSVAQGSPADLAGLRAGDELVTVNGVDGGEPKLLSDRRPGTEYALRVRRGGQEHDLRLVVGAAPTRQEVEATMRAYADCTREAAARPGPQAERQRRINACMVPY
ncbi:MAG TPA: M56 family metallopeptidase [Longimicrobium sp.]|nr:M56 family metallopeptidase [Longimicrobium sp.]